MALLLLRVLVLGVVAAAADDANITWWRGPRASLPCVIPDRERVRVRRPPPPLDDERPRPKPYVWTYEGQKIDNAKLPSNGSLEVIHKKDGGGEGVYQCGVFHQGGFILGYPIHMNFAYMDTHFAVHPKKVITRAGQPIVMDCSIDSKPTAVITWIADNNEVLRDVERHYYLEDQLLITNVRKEDKAVYQCTATNKILETSRSSRSGRLQVVESNEELELAFLDVHHVGNVTAVKGARVVLPCPVIGWPRPELIWELTPPEGRRSELEFTGEVLVLPDLEFDQEGVYTCGVVGNSNLVKTFNVTLVEPPSITIPPTPKEALRAGTIRFNCTAVGKPAPTIKWFKDGQPLVLGGRINLRTSTDGKRTELVISGVTSNDAGVYQCFAQNLLQTVSSWATLNVTGVDAAAPEAVQCWPEGHDLVRLTWKPPVALQVVAYTVHTILQDSKVGSTSLPGSPNPTTEQLIPLPQPLTPYRFQVRAYLQPSAKIKNVASDMSKAVVCQGQGVPIQLAKLNDNEILVSWKQFASQNPEVVQWILQYKEDDKEHNVTLNSEVLNYTLKTSPSSPMQVRVLGSRSIPWLQQNLEHVPWMSTSNAGVGIDDGDEPAVPQDLEASQVSARSFTINWRLDSPVKHVFSVCLRKLNDKEEECKESQKSSTTFEDLQPNSDYEVRVQARAVGRSVSGALSAPYVVTTLSEGSYRFRNLSGQFVNSTTLRISWSGPPSRYTVLYSAQLKLPVEQWDSVQTDGNTVLISGIDPTDKTYVIVKENESQEPSKIETILPLYKDLDMKDLHFAYTSAGVRVWWGVGGAGAGVRLVCAAQQITRPVEQWDCHRADGEIELTDLDPSLPTYVMVTLSKKHKSQVLTIEPRPNDYSSLYLGIGVTCGAFVLCLVAIATVCLWRKRKHARLPWRSRRRNVTLNEGNEEEGSEMKNIGGRLANGSKDAGQPLLNGHVHITENPSPRTPNGKTKNRLYEAAFDVSRFDDNDVTQETVLDPDTSVSTGFNPLDTSRKPEYEVSRSSREVSANDSFNKLPDDNMNSEINRSTFNLDNSKIQPTLQPNG